MAAENTWYAGRVSTQPRIPGNQPNTLTRSRLFACTKSVKEKAEPGFEQRKDCSKSLGIHGSKW